MIPPSPTPPPPTAAPLIPTPTPTRLPPTPTSTVAPPTPFPIETLARGGELSAFTVAISLKSLHDFSGLEKRTEFKEALELARRHPKGRIFLTVYVTEADADERNADPKSLSDLMIVELGRLIAQRGIAPERISGTGMGVNPAVGRKLIFSLDTGAAR